MQQNRDYAISQTLEYEGGYSNDPSDSGGATNFGITINDARKYWKHDATPEDVKNMSKDIAINIYKTKYWVTSEYNCDNLSSGVDLITFDTGVLQGPAKAKEFLMASIGGTDVETINKMSDMRVSFFNNLARSRPKDQKFLKGWLRRAESMRQTAIKMASEDTEKPAGASKSDQGTNTTSDQNKPLSDDDSDLGDKVDQAKSWWDRFKDWDINWKAFFRQFSIAGSAVVGFATDHKIIALTAVTGIALFALWVALGKPHFWKPWRLFK